MKRIADIAFAAIVLVALSPVMAAAALAIWVTDPGPVIYRGARVGCNGRIFHILKFRSMRQHTDGVRAITVGHDTRVTAVGRVLRATKLDELPQMINVLRGDMSVVGPRPESPDFVAQYTPEQREVLSVRPGITGASQIYFRHEEQLLDGPEPERYYLEAVMPAKLVIDIDYVRRASVRFDIKVLLYTAISLVRPFPPPPLPPRSTNPATEPALATPGSQG